MLEILDWGSNEVESICDCTNVTCTCGWLGYGSAANRGNTAAMQALIEYGKMIA